MYTIQMAARETGLSQDTLRAWERRYGVVRPQRTDSGYRLYDAAAIATLRAMRELVDAGWPPSRAAEQVRARGEGVTDIAEPAVPAGRAEPDETAEPAAERPGVGAFLAAAAALDTVAVTRVLDEEFALASFETAVDGWLMPALEALGRAWADGRVSVAAEHLAAYCVTRRLGMAYDAAGPNPRGPRVTIGLPPGARHELGTLAFAVAARRAGLATVYLGADVPRDDWMAASSGDTRAAVLGIPSRRDIVRATTVTAALAAEEPDLLLAVGGKHQERMPDRCLRLGHRIGPAAAALAARLA